MISSELSRYVMHLSARCKSLPLHSAGPGLAPALAVFYNCSGNEARRSTKWKSGPCRRFSLLPLRSRDAATIRTNSYRIQWNFLLYQFPILCWIQLPLPCSPSTRLMHQPQASNWTDLRYSIWSMVRKYFLAILCRYVLIVLWLRVW